MHWTKDARLVIGVVIIKHKLCLSDRETVEQIQENPYLRYFVGLPGYQMEVPFVPSLLVEIRKRMGPSVFDVFQTAIIDAVEGMKMKQKRMPGKKRIRMMMSRPLFPEAAHKMAKRTIRAS